MDHGTADMHALTLSPRSVTSAPLLQGLLGGGGHACLTLSPCSVTSAPLLKGLVGGGIDESQLRGGIVKG